MKEVISLLEAQLRELKEKKEILADVANKDVLDVLDDLIIDTRGRLKGVELALEFSGRDSGGKRGNSRWQAFSAVIGLIELGSRFLSWLAETFPWM